MKLQEITYSRGQTRQLQEYQPTNIHFSAKAELEEGEDPHAAFLELKTLVDTEIGIADKMLTEPQKVVRAAATMVYNKSQEKEFKSSDVPF